MKRITTRAVLAAQPRERPYDIRDGEVPGLLLRIHPTGRKAWYVTWDRGKRRKLGAWPVTTVEAARTQALKALAEAAATGLPSIARPSARTLGDFLKIYGPWVTAHRKGGARTLQMLQVFSEFFDTALSDLHPWQIEKWRLRRLKEVQPATVNRQLVALKSMLSMAVEWRAIDQHPLPVKLSKIEQDPRVRFLSADEEARLREALSDRDQEAIRARASANEWRRSRGYRLLSEIPTDGFADHLTPLVLTAMNTGCRRGELTGLEWSEVDLEGRVLTVRAHTSKRAVTRRVPLNEEAVDVLTRWKRQSPERPFPVFSVKTSWAALMKKAGIEDLRFHDLRHHFASRLVQRGVDLYAVQKLLGHASPVMTQRYSHLADENLAEAVGRL